MTDQTFGPRALNLRRQGRWSQVLRRPLVVARLGYGIVTDIGGLPSFAMSMLKSPLELVAENGDLVSGATRDLGTVELVTTNRFRHPSSLSGANLFLPLRRLGAEQEPGLNRELGKRSEFAQRRHPSREQVVARSKL